MDVLNKQELATYLKVGIPTVNYLLYQKKIPKVKIGREYRFPQEDIDRWIKRKKEPEKAYSFRKF